MSQQIVTIDDAFEVLQIAVGKALAAAHEDASEALQTGNFHDAQWAPDHDRTLSQLRERVEKLQAEFEDLFGEATESPDDRRRLRAGLRTPWCCLKMPCTGSTHRTRWEGKSERRSRTLA